MKVISCIVLSFVCICSARNIKWTPEQVASSTEIEVDREAIKEQIHKYFAQLANALGERDEQNVKEFLHLIGEMYRPDLNGENEDAINSHRPFPFPDEQMDETMMKPFHHKDIPRPIVGDKEMVRPFPQKHIMRPLHAEDDIPESLILRPLEPATDDINEHEVMRPLPYKPQRPHHYVTLGVNGEMENSLPEKHIMRPLHSRPTEHDRETMRPLSPVMRPLEDMSDEVMEHEPMMKPLPQNPNQRPQYLAPIEVDGEMENSLPQKHVMLPLFVPGMLDEELPSKVVESKVE